LKDAQQPKASYYRKFSDFVNMLLSKALLV
jgi:hypothetical protein